MAEMPLPGSLSRRHLLIAAAASCSPLAVHAVGIYTPYELAQRYEEQVDLRLRLPAEDVHLYGSTVEEELLDYEQIMLAPQYLLVVDSNPNVQAAFLFWRLMEGHYRLIGASPASTAGPVLPHRLESPQGLFDQTPAAVQTRPVSSSLRRGLRVYDFSPQRARTEAGTAAHSNMRLQARAADRKAARFLGSAQSDGCILLPSTLISFLDEFGVLDAAGTSARPARADRPPLPYRGRYLLVVDSERDERPQWSPSPEAASTAALR